MGKKFSGVIDGNAVVHQGVLAFMIRQRRGSIINIGSCKVSWHGRNSAAYTAIKTAIVG
jgi:NADP-dependent 3-hydroxy acid dehydrogenase YdfG